MFDNVGRLKSRLLFIIIKDLICWIYISSLTESTTKAMKTTTLTMMKCGAAAAGCKNKTVVLCEQKLNSAVESNLAYNLFLSSLLWRPTQLNLRGGRAKKWGTFIPI